MLLFDDDEQLEVRHVISLAHHDVSLYSGGDNTPEGELFIKRNAICLSRRTDGAEVAPDTQVSKPFYLFSENCSAKEDFYFSLLRNQEFTLGADGASPRPAQFDVKNIISLVQKLHSSEDHLQTRWLNAMIGRVFLGIYQTKDLEHFIRTKLTKKISRVKRPSFLSGISIQKIDTGESAPYFTNPRLKDLTVEGECGIEADVRYTGNFRIEVAATARIDLGTRFKAREVNLVLAVVLKKLEGHMLFKIKPPPSNRVWFSFQQMPKVEMLVEPIISSRQITYTVFLRQIENRIKEVLAETLVLPFWDDMPFFNTEHKQWRGGIWDGDDAVASPGDLEAAVAQMGDVDETDRLEESGMSSPEFPPVEKSHSIPVMESTPPTGLFGRKLNGKVAANQQASASSTSVEARSQPPGKKPKRSNSFVDPPAPTTGTDVTNADVFKPSSSPPNKSHAVDAMASLSARSQGASPTHTPVGSPQRQSVASHASGQSSASSGELATAEKDSDQTPQPNGRRDTASSAGSLDGDAAKTGSPAPSGAGSLRSHTGSITRNLFRRDTAHSAGSSSAGSEAPKRTALAAVSQAAASAKRWGLGALQRNPDGKDGHSATDSAASSTLDLSKPMGGGRPLPPPGVPLPLPDKRTRLPQVPFARRKVPPPQLPDRPRPEEPRTDRRAVPAPPLPKRRHMAESPPDGDGAADVLVVAAPTDSDDPGTPGASAGHSPVSPGYVRPWVDDAHEENDTNEVEAAAEPGGEADETPPADRDGVFDLHIGHPSEEHRGETVVADDDDDAALEAWMGQHEIDDDPLSSDLDHAQADSPLAEPGAAVASEETAQ